MRTFFLLALGFETAFCVQATASVDCQHRVFALTTLALNPAAKQASREHPAFGFVASKRGLLKLAEGRYVFAVTQSGQVVFSPAIPSWDPKLLHNQDPVIVSHRSLAGFERRRTKAEPRFICAGDFTLVRPLEDPEGPLYVQTLTNRSQTFPGDTASLIQAVPHLRAHGLPIGPTTSLVDYSNGLHVDTHIPAQERVLAAIRYQKDPGLQILEQFKRQLVKRAPHPRIQDHFDPTMITEILDGFRARLDVDPTATEEQKQIVLLAYQDLRKMEEWGLGMLRQVLEAENVSPQRFVLVLASLGLFDQPE